MKEVLRKDPEVYKKFLQVMFDFGKSEKTPVEVRDVNTEILLHRFLPFSQRNPSLMAQIAGCSRLTFHTVWMYTVSHFLFFSGPSHPCNVSLAPGIVAMNACQRGGNLILIQGLAS